MTTGQCEQGDSLFGVFSSQVTLGWVKLTRKTNQHYMSVREFLYCVEVRRTALYVVYWISKKEKASKAVLSTPLDFLTVGTTPHDQLPCALRLSNLHHDDPRTVSQGKPS